MYSYFKMDINLEKGKLRYIMNHGNKVAPTYCLCTQMVHTWYEVFGDKQAFTCIVPYEHNQDDRILSGKNVLYQRNDLSYLLNKQRQMVRQLECTQDLNNISSSGAWCKNESLPTSSQHITDYKIAKQLSNYLRGKRVGSFEDGPELYKKYFDQSKMLSVYEAYDGAPFAESISSGNVKFLDLSVPQFGIPIYDWIINLEVAEHIPEKYESTFLSNLARHAKTGII